MKLRNHDEILIRNKVNSFTQGMLILATSDQTSILFQSVFYQTLCFYLLIRGSFEHCDYLVLNTLSLVQTGDQ